MMIKRIGVASGLLALLALGVIGVSSAFALQLPDISTSLKGSAYPLHLNYESKTVNTVIEEKTGASSKAKA